MTDRIDRRRRRRRREWARWCLRIAAALAIFAVGVALGEALHDNPQPGSTITYVRTLPRGSTP